MVSSETRCANQVECDIEVMPRGKSRIHCTACHCFKSKIQYIIQNTRKIPTKVNRHYFYNAQGQIMGQFNQGRGFSYFKRGNECFILKWQEREAHFKQEIILKKKNDFGECYLYICMLYSLQGNVWWLGFWGESVYIVNYDKHETWLVVGSYELNVVFKLKVIFSG